MLSLGKLFPCRGVLLQSRDGGGERESVLGRGFRRGVAQKTRFASQGADPPPSTPLASRGRSDVICEGDSPAALSSEDRFCSFAQLQKEGEGGLKVQNPEQLFHLGFLPSVRKCTYTSFSLPTLLTATPLPTDLFHRHLCSSCVISLPGFEIYINATY